MTPLSEEPIRIWPRLAPFAGATVLAFVLVFFTAAINGAEFAGGVAVCALVVAVAFGVPWVRVPYGLRVVPPMIFLLSALLLRDAAGGVSSGVGVLALLPVFWVALHGRTQELAIVLAGTAVYYLVPIIAIGEPPTRPRVTGPPSSSSPSAPSSAPRCSDSSRTAGGAHGASPGTPRISSASRRSPGGSRRAARRGSTSASPRAS